MRVVLLLLLALLAAPSAAAAHGGDAQRDLLAGDTSYPDGAPAPLVRALDGMVEQARGNGYALKVALVQDQYDVEQNRTWLYDAQAYADHVSGLLGPGERVLTVHPGGFGGNALGEKPALAITELQDEQTTALEELMLRAMRGVAAATKAHGTPVALPAVARASAGGDGGGGVPVWLIVAGPIVLIGIGLVGVSLMGRDDEDDAPAAST